MTEDKTKKQFLEAANYKHNFSRDIYFNKKDKKIFSGSAIADHDENWLSEKLAAESNENGWDFYFNEQPGEDIKQEILNELN